MGTKIGIAFVFAILISSTFMPRKGWTNTRHLPILRSQANNSGANIFEAYDETKSLKQRLERLDGFALYLKHTALRAYVISYGGRRSCRGEALRRARFAKDYLSKIKGIDQKRITEIDGGYRDKWAVYLWVGAQGEAPPTPLPTVDRRDVKITKNCTSKISSRKRKSS